MPEPSAQPRTAPVFLKPSQAFRQVGYPADASHLNRGQKRCQLYDDDKWEPGPGTAFAGCVSYSPEHMDHSKEELRECKLVNLAEQPK